MIRALAACAVAALVVGCRGQQETAPGDEDQESVVEAPQPTPAPLEPETPGAAPAVWPEPGKPRAAEPGKPGAAAKPTGEAEAPSRDLAAELKAAVGAPTECLQGFKAKAPMTLRIDVSAVVRPTGMVIEPSASGPGLTAPVRRCVERRFGAVVLEPLDKPLSQTVFTFLELRYEPAVIVEAEPPPEHKPEDVVLPLPKKEPIAPSGEPIEGPPPDSIEGPSGKPIEGPEGVPISGPKGVPIEQDGYE